MTLAPETPPPNTPEEIFSHMERLLIETWRDTGYGHLEIDTERLNSKKIQVFVRGSTHYRYIICDRDVNKWTSKNSP
ncbi:hypothetical protein PN499_06985 [Kamptonema animale CS-326]|uniref:hypothetical protein n=1 Tax=Kamptonema animale TaxID=92934 RepID=UPI0023308C75|nr:hypothetical protein [Kamptonema animale]MDB9510921.1 hypothetical protein [Kamptonema animale CS-326]